MARLTAKARSKRHPLNMRTTREIREGIARAARASGRSMAHEVEHRLELSFLGQPGMVAAMNRLAAAIEEANRPKGLGGPFGQLGSIGAPTVGSMMDCFMQGGHNGKINS